MTSLRLAVMFGFIRAMALGTDMVQMIANDGGHGTDGVGDGAEDCE